jgi:hypothetical protein
MPAGNAWRVRSVGVGVRVRGVSLGFAKMAGVGLLRIDAALCFGTLIPAFFLGVVLLF